MFYQNLPNVSCRPLARRNGAGAQADPQKNLSYAALGYIYYFFYYESLGPGVRGPLQKQALTEQFITVFTLAFYIFGNFGNTLKFLS